MNALSRCIAGLFTGLLVLVLFVVLICFEGTSFTWKQAYVLPQWLMLLCGAIALCGLCVLLGRGVERKPKWPLLAPGIAWLALLGVQLVLCFHTYFITGWDVRSIMESAYAFAGGESNYHSGYLSMCHNNIPITLLFAAIIRVIRFFLGNPGMDRCIYVLIAGQCVLNTMTGMLSFFIAQRLTGSRRFAWCMSLVYMVFVGLSPWVMIPYTDSMSLIFPTAIIAAYLFQPKRWGRTVKWLSIGLIAGVGYLIKAQVAIVIIAIVIIEVLHAIGTKRLLSCGFQMLSMLLVVGILVGPVRQALIAVTPANIRPYLALNMPHYAMLGLNRETNGVYDYDDVLLSLSAPTVEERTKLQITEIKRRLSDMTAADMLDHYKKKTLTIYADGTFAWACEGEFYTEWIEDKDDVLSPFLKSLVNKNSDRFVILLTAMHCIWLALLLGCVLYGLKRLFSRGKTHLDVLCVMMLAVIGLVLFVWIFEARARYLYLFAPYFVMLGMHGWWRVLVRRPDAGNGGLIGEE